MAQYSPAVSSPRCTPCREMVSGSIIAAWVQLSDAGFFTSRREGWQKYSAMPPSVCTPSTLRLVQQFVRLMEHG